RRAPLRKETPRIPGRLRSRTSAGITGLTSISSSLVRKLAFKFRGGALASNRPLDRKSTRLNSSHLVISYAVFCLKKKKKKIYVHASYAENIVFAENSAIFKTT